MELRPFCPRQDASHNVNIKKIHEKIDVMIAQKCNANLIPALPKSCLMMQQGMGEKGRRKKRRGIPYYYEKQNKDVHAWHGMDQETSCFHCQ